MTRPGLLLSAMLVWIFASAPALAISTVVIDAGHGGHDRGGVPGQRYAEKIYTLDVAKRLSSRLRSAGYRTVMTRSGDYFVSLDQRCAIANRQLSAIFISIHFNAAPRPTADGIETYYYSGYASAGLASSIHKRVVSAAGSENRGVRRRSFYVIRRTRCPAVLVECGFLSSPAEGSRIAHSSAHRQRLADAIANGIIARYR